MYVLPRLTDFEASLYQNFGGCQSDDRGPCYMLLTALISPRDNFSVVSLVCVDTLASHIRDPAAEQNGAPL